jgi:hypothetical protein
MMKLTSEERFAVAIAFVMLVAAMMIVLAGLSGCLPD